MQASGAVVQSLYRYWYYIIQPVLLTLHWKKDDLYSGCNTSRMYRVYIWNKVRQNHAVIFVTLRKFHSFFCLPYTTRRPVRAEEWKFNITAVRTLYWNTIMRSRPVSCNMLPTGQHNLVIRGEYFMSDLLFCKINLNMFPCQSSETWRRLGNADKIPYVVTPGTCGRGTVTSVSIRHERWTLHHPVQCLRLLWGREGNTYGLSIVIRFSNRST
jgi:hypothetical protein